MQNNSNNNRGNYEISRFKILLIIMTGVHFFLNNGDNYHKPDSTSQNVTTHNFFNIML